MRPSSWDEPWCQEGTRPRAVQPGSLSPPDKPRWLVRFAKRGGPNWICEVHVPGNGTELHWATLRPPTHWDDPDPTWLALLRRRWWIDGDGYWLGPERGRKGEPDKGKGKGAYAGKGKGKGKAKGPPLEWARIVTQPDGYNVDPHGQWSPITRLAEQLVTSPMEETEFSASTDRQRRARAFLVSQYKHRFFVDDASEVRVRRYRSVPPVRVPPKKLYP